MPTARQRLFVAQYLVDHNATQAAVRAGYSAKTAEQLGSRLLKNKWVAEAIEAGLAKQEKRIERTADDVLRELWKLALVDIGLAFDANGALLSLAQMPEDVRRAISGIEVDELFAGDGEARSLAGRTRKVKLWEKTKALELLGKHFKLFTEKHEHGVDGELADLLREARTRAQRR